jgi:hypothetical protein
VLQTNADALMRLFNDTVSRSLNEKLTEEPNWSGWSARSTADVPGLQSHNPESAKSHAALQAADSSLDRQVVSRNVLQFREALDPDGQVSVTAAVYMSLWFHTVDSPHYAGKTIEFSHSASHPESAWLTSGSALLAAEVESAADMMASELAAALLRTGHTR